MAAHDLSPDAPTPTRISGFDLGELSKPATVLIEKISDAVGGIFRPWQIVRVTKAEVEAERLKAEGQIAITDVQRRAFHRFLQEEVQKQENMEVITREAIPQLDSGADPSKIENDWIANFFDKCRIVSDAEMQVLWSKILAGEANRPGAFSKRTVSIVASLSTQDAEMFILYCSFCWSAANGARYSIDSDVVARFWPSRTVPFNTAQMHLRDLGLLGSIGGVGHEWSKIPERDFTYFDENYRLRFGPGYQKPYIEPMFCTFTHPRELGWS